MLGLTGKEGHVLFIHCLLLVRFYIFSCKYKSSKPSIVELYIYKVKENFIISIIKETQKIFEEKWKKSYSEKAFI